MQSSVEIALSIFIGLGVSCVMVLALREGAVRLRDVFVTLASGIAGAILGSVSVQLMPAAQDNLLVISAAATMVGGLAAVLGEMVTMVSGAADPKTVRGSGELEAIPDRSVLIDRTIIRLRAPGR